MERAISIWSGMDNRRRIVASLAALAMFAAVLALARTASTPSMALLYAGLEPGAAGDVVGAVEQMGVAVEIRGGAIYVDEAQRDRTRMALAAQGLPRNGPAGYEILDGLSGFGTTSEMFDAAYWRAKEGELARTILASGGVRMARVHIANPVRRPFQRRTDPSASVTITSSFGPVDVAQAEAVRHLVASAVAGLKTDAVAVIDADNGVVLKLGDGGDDAPPATTIANREEKMRADLERLLEARVGEGAVMVDVAIDANMEAETVSERVFDPQSRVAISTSSEEMTETSSEGGGAVTVASNLPDGDAKDDGGDSRSRSETRERVNYEVSEVTRQRVKPAGEIRRISVAVLVDGVVEVGADGERAWTPRSAEELTALGNLVRSAIGYDEARGDVVTVENLEFSAPAAAGVAASSGVMQFLSRNAMSIAQMVFLGLVALALGLFVVKPVLASGPAPNLMQPASPHALGAADEIAAAPELSAIDGEPASDAAAITPDPSDRPADRLTQLRDLFSDRNEESTSLLRNWLEHRDADEEQGQ